MSVTPRDRFLWVLIAALGVDTVVSMTLSLSGLFGPAEAGPGGRAWMGLVWFVLVLAVLAGSLRRMRCLTGLLSTRDEQMAAVTATSHDWLWEADAQMVATACSPAIGELLGREPEEIIGRHFVDFLTDEDVVLAEAMRTAAVRDRAGWNDVALRWRHADGHLVTMTGSAVPVYDARGRVIGFRGTRRLAPAGVAVEQRLSAITHRVGEVLEARSIEVALQPIVALDTAKWTGVEALARFPDNRPPDVWFAEAHEAGVGVDLELAAVQAALGAAADLPASIRLSVNASPGLILDPRLAHALGGSGVSLERITVEITEHAAVSRYDDIRAALLPLREHGLALAVDDTGAGYASFTHVLHLRPDVIKLDRSLIGNIHADPARRAFVTAIVLLALELGATVTAEGVETEPELITLASLGIDHAQGYLLARPTPDPDRWRAWADRTWSNGLGSVLSPETLAPRA